MNQAFQTLIDFQIALVQASRAIAGLGVVLLGLGIVISSSAPVFSYRLKRLGLQILGAVFLVLFLHFMATTYWGGRTPPVVLIGVYGIIALMILQGALNLFFGPTVGNSVTAQLLKTLILVIVGLSLAAYAGLF